MSIRLSDDSHEALGVLSLGVCLRDRKGVNSVGVCEWQETGMKRLEKWETSQSLRGLMEDELSSARVRRLFVIARFLLL